jgi:radical SAM protein with 4Fe4S-binding SPASM domain
MNRPRPRIMSLIFEVTQRCNHACLHCYNVWNAGDDMRGKGNGSYPRGELDTERTLLLLGKALDETECPHVTLTGGEPLLRADLPVLLDFIRRRGARATVISNGRLLTEAFAADLIERGADLFELPLLSPMRETHDRLSGAGGAWDSVLAAMAALRLQHGRFAAAFVATRLNIDDVYETVKLAFGFGASAVMFNRFNPGGRGRGNLDLLLPSAEQVRRALGEADRASADFGVPVSCSIPIQPCLIDTRAFTHIGFAYCAAGGSRTYYALDPMGNLRPCNHTPMILGNLFEESFAELVDPERLTAFTAPVPAFCAGCRRRSECQGGCKAAAQVCYGALDAEEPFLKNNRERANLTPGRDLSSG